MDGYDGGDCVCEREQNKQKKWWKRTTYRMVQFEHFRTFFSLVSENLSCTPIIGTVLMEEDLSVIALADLNNTEAN